MTAVKVTLKTFNNAKQILSAADEATKRQFSRFGALARGMARRRLNRKSDDLNRHSAPGQPPIVHSKHKTANLKYILYFYEPRIKTLVVGPVIWERGQKPGQRPGPGLQELGGSTPFTYTRRGKKHKTTATYPPRPYMGPSFDAAQNELDIMWANAIRPKT